MKTGWTCFINKIENSNDRRDKSMMLKVMPVKAHLSRLTNVQTNHSELVKHQEEEKFVLYLEKAK